MACQMCLLQAFEFFPLAWGTLCLIPMPKQVMPWLGILAVAAAVILDQPPRWSDLVFFRAKGCSERVLEPRLCAGEPPAPMQKPAMVNAPNAYI